jgi:hypothetical protein
MRAQQARHLFHGTNAGAHRACAPKVKKPTGSKGSAVIPEELKIFLKQIAAHRLQVVAQ